MEFDPPPIASSPPAPETRRGDPAWHHLPKATLKALASHGVQNEEEFLSFNALLLKGPIVSERVAHHQERLRGFHAFRDRQPLGPTATCLSMRAGGIVFRGDQLVACAPMNPEIRGHFLQLERGALILRDRQPADGEPYMARAGYGICFDLRGSNGAYGVYGDQELDRAATRAVFGMETEALWLLCDTYGEAAGLPPGHPPRIKSGSGYGRCSLSGQAFNGHVPFIDYTTAEGRALHLSLSGFYHHVHGAVQRGGTGERLKERMTERGVTEEMWSLLGAADQAFARGITFEDYQAARAAAL